MSRDRANSWVPAEGLLEEKSSWRILSLPVPQFGLRVLLAVVTVLFLLLGTSYLVRMQVWDWRPLQEPGILVANTAVLILSSIALQWAKTCAETDRIKEVRQGFLAAGLLTCVFLVGQLYAWSEIRHTVVFLERNPSTSFFYLVTLIHGLHLVGGLVAWVRASLRIRRGAAIAQVRMSIEMCAVYWHFLLAVWLVFYGLMLST
ncbi:MAG: cytochrome oxidase subunit III [Methylococcus sp.]|nr:MAG: cytochrome oxidase subunit III [Methylococcus sp.]